MKNNTWTKGCDFGFKVGQRVWSSLLGFGTIEEICSDSFPIIVNFDNGHDDSYMMDGRSSGKHEHPSLFHVEQTFDYGNPKWQPEPGELCWVWDDKDNVPSTRKFVEIKNDEMWFDCVQSGFGQIHWKHCAPFDGKLPDEFKHLEGGGK